MLPIKLVMMAQSLGQGDGSGVERHNRGRTAYSKDERSLTFNEVVGRGSRRSASARGHSGRHEAIRPMSHRTAPARCDIRGTAVEKSPPKKRASFCVDGFTTAPGVPPGAVRFRGICPLSRQPKEVLLPRPLFRAPLQRLSDLVEELVRVPPAELELFAGVQMYEVPAAEPGDQPIHGIEIDDGRPMDPLEALGVEL